MVGLGAALSTFRRKGLNPIFVVAWGLLSPEVGAESQVLDFEESVRLALEQNEDLLLARADRQKSKQRVREVRADGLPHLDVAVDYDRNWLLPRFVFAGNEVKIGTDNNITSALRLRQPLYTGGRVKAVLASAQLSKELAGEVERAVLQDVVGRVATDFYEVLLTVELLRVSEQGLVTGRKNLQQVQALRRAGRASDYDLLRAEVQVGNLQADSLQVSNLWETAHMVFKNTIGLALDAPIEVKGNFRVGTSLDVNDLDKLVAMGLARHPQIQQFERRLRIQQRTIQVEKAASRPSVDLVASGQMQFQNDQLDVLDEEWSRSWDTGVSVAVPLFDGMRTRARVAQAKVDLARIELQREQVEKTIRLQVRQAWLDVRQFGERVRAHAATVAQAERGLGIAESRYTAGAGTQLEVFDAQLLLVQAQTEYATAQRDRALALVRLEQATGVLGEELL